jgi:3-oxoacyl-[acyl-carrier protein] reductase
MPSLLEDKVAIVTGASQGLGKAIAVALGSDGAKVLLVARRETELESVAAEVRNFGGEAEVHVADVMRPRAAGEIVEAAERRFAKLDILVNCAGVFVWKKFLDVTIEDFETTSATNLGAPFFLTQEAARSMVRRGQGGSIINIASIHGAVGDAWVVPQCAAKAGVIGLTRAAAEALREHHVRVNAVSPGSIEPDSLSRRGETPNRKVTQADIATLVVFLSSDLAKTITGSVIDMYGSTHTVIRA